MRRRRIYIAGPISKGDLRHNIEQANQAFFALLRAGLAPWCPHWSCFSSEPWTVPASAVPCKVLAEAQILPRGTRPQDWYGLDLAWVEVAEAVFRLPGESTGADLEAACAREHGIPVFHTIDEAIAWGSP